MTSEIRVNKIENRSGLGTVTFADTGVDLAGIVTATTFSGSGASLTGLPAAQLSGTLPAISAANLTNVPAANITGTLPAISAANLTNVPAANITGTLPALTAANLTNIPAANLVGVCTSGLTKTGGFGAILQVVQHSFTNETSSTSTSDVAISGSAKALTLTSSSSSVLIIANIYCYHTRSYSGQGMSLTLRKTVSGGSITDIYEPKDGGQMFDFDTSQLTSHTGRAMQTLVHMDTPGNTGVTYELSGRGYTSNNSGSWAVNRTDNGDTARSQVVFLEVAG